MLKGAPDTLAVRVRPQQELLLRIDPCCPFLDVARCIDQRTFQINWRGVHRLQE